MKIRAFEATAAEITNWEAKWTEPSYFDVKAYGFVFNPELNGIKNSIDSTYVKRSYRRNINMPRYICSELDRTNGSEPVVVVIDPSVSRNFRRMIRREFAAYAEKTGKPVSFEKPNGNKV